MLEAYLGLLVVWILIVYDTFCISVQPLAGNFGNKS